MSTFAHLRPSDKVAHVLAVWFGCGHLPLAPGTWGTIGALPLYLALRPHGLAPVACAALAVALVGVWAAHRVVVATGEQDPQIVCIDEVAGVLVTWLGAPPGLWGTLAGLVLFRILDTVKPWPARSAERRLRGGLGVMMDDIAAGAWGAAILGAVRAVDWLL